MTANSTYLGVILVIVIVIIAFFAWRLWRSHVGRDRFTYSTPSTPRMREAAGCLFANLQHMVTLGRSFEDQASRLADATPVAGARQAAAMMVASLSRTEKALCGAPPTYANYLAIYRGLVSTDVALLNAADAYVNAGHTVSQSVALSPAGSPSGPPASMANTLIAMGHQMRQVVASVHRLGVALDVE
jgi:hypothetical protein